MDAVQAQEIEGGEYDIQKETKEWQKAIIDHCDRGKKGPLQRADPEQFYQFVWLDPRVNNDENQLYKKSF